jgi:zinc D-Ala-D-Ala carboxypeptidase
MTWRNFSRQEFACKCGCGTNGIQDRFIDVAQELRDEVGFALVCSSGYRCADHPIESRKASPGEHSEGTCADFLVSHQSAVALLKAAAAHPAVTGIGVNQKGDGRFLHIGIGEPKPSRPRPHLWSY